MTNEYLPKMLHVCNLLKREDRVSINISDIDVHRVTIWRGENRHDALSAWRPTVWLFLESSIYSN